MDTPRHAPDTALAAEAPAAEAEKDFLPINGTDYVEFYVGNAKQAAHYYQSAFGFQLVGYRGPETGTRDRASYLLVQNKIRLELTSALGPDSDIPRPASLHADGVRHLAPRPDDARAAFAAAVEPGHTPVYEPARPPHG